MDHAGHFGQRCGPEDKPTRTIIGTALEKLGVEVILANSPQARGRVEQAFGTAQDRLVKGMRLARIATLEEANRYLEEQWIPFWNERFTVAPADPQAETSRRPLRRNRSRPVQDLVPNSPAGTATPAPVPTGVGRDRRVGIRTPLTATLCSPLTFRLARRTPASDPRPSTIPACFEAKIGGPRFLVLDLMELRRYVLSEDTADIPQSGKEGQNGHGEKARNLRSQARQ